MKIIIIGVLKGFNLPASGGPERALKNQINGLTKYNRDNDITLFPIGFQEPTLMNLSNNITIYPLPFDLSKRPMNHAEWLIAKRYLAKIIKVKQPDIIVSHDPLFNNLLPTPIRKRTAVILHGPFYKEHFLVYTTLRTLHKLVYRSLIANQIRLVNLKISKLIICAASSIREELFRDLKAKSIILENPVADEMFGLSKERELSKKRRAYIVSVGRIFPRKNYETLIMAVKNLLDVNKSYKDTLRVRIIGAYDGSFAWYFRRLVSMIKTFGLAEIVDIFTNASEDDLRNEYKNADIYVHTGLLEGLPNAIQEAMAAGIPPVASKSGDLPSIIHEGRNGLLYNPYDCERLAQHLNTLLTDPHYRLKLGERARITAHDRWSLSRYISKLNLILESL
jgi:glycosyltransferase involved in cell wall biosynthesis